MADAVRQHVTLTFCREVLKLFTKSHRGEVAYKTLVCKIVDLMLLKFPDMVLDRNTLDIVKYMLSNISDGHGEGEPELQ